MKYFVEDLVGQLSGLYDMYEYYMWKHDDSRLEVLIQDNMICFYLYKGKEVIDEFFLSFHESETDVWTYFSIRVMIILLGNVIIHRDENILYNNVHKPYLKLTVNDEHVLDIMIKIISMQNMIPIHGKMEILEDMRSDLPWRFYPNKFMRRVKQRIDISRKLLRGGDLR